MSDSPKVVTMAEALAAEKAARGEAAPIEEAPSSNGLVRAELLAAGKLTPKVFAEKILNSYEFRSYLLSSLATGSLPAAVIVRLMDIAWGKPVERLEASITTSNALENATDEELEQRYQFLISALRELRGKREDRPVH